MSDRAREVERLLREGCDMAEGLRALVADRYPNHQQHDQGDYVLGVYATGFVHWRDEALVLLSRMRQVQA